MQRLNKSQVDQRIHKFLARKLSEFPELDQEIETLVHDWPTTDINHSELSPAQHWNFQTT